MGYNIQIARNSCGRRQIANFTLLEEQSKVKKNIMNRERKDDKTSFLSPILMFLLIKDMSVSHSCLSRQFLLKKVKLGENKMSDRPYMDKELK